MKSRPLRINPPETQTEAKQDVRSTINKAALSQVTNGRQALSRRENRRKALH
jgi:hypothetical protein